jgi:hypothetical protein
MLYGFDLTHQFQDNNLVYNRQKGRYIKLTQVKKINLYTSIRFKNLEIC